MADGFCFHRLGEPSDALLLLLSLLLAPAPPHAAAATTTGYGAGVASGAPAAATTGAAACRAFAALPATERHQRAAVAGTGGLGLRILVRAVQVRGAAPPMHCRPGAHCKPCAPYDGWLRPRCSFGAL